MENDFAALQLVKPYEPNYSDGIPDDCVDRLDLVFGKVQSQKNGKEIGVNPRTGARFIRNSDRFLKYRAEELKKLKRIARRLQPPYATDIRFYIGSLNRFDPDNAETTINDLLVKSGIFEDDSIFQIQETRRRLAGAIQGEPRVEITLFSLRPSLFDHNVALLRAKDEKPGTAPKERFKAEAKRRGLTQAALETRLWLEIADLDIICGEY